MKIKDIDGNVWDPKHDSAAYGDTRGVEVGICGRCAHAFESAACEAYPDGIPVEVLTGKIDHRKPYKGDHGIQFEPWGLYAEREKGGEDDNPNGRGSGGAPEPESAPRAREAVLVGAGAGGSSPG